MRILVWSLLVVALDQATKLLTKAMLNLGETVVIVGNTVRLTYIENRGMAFGLDVGNQTVFTVLSFGISGVLLYYLIQHRQAPVLARLPLALILGGAVGNLIDRVTNAGGGVVDFLDVDIPDIRIAAVDLAVFQTPRIELLRWPIFNVADIAVTLGMMILLSLAVLDMWPDSEGDAAPAE